MDRINWGSIYDDGAFGLAHVKQEGGWFIGPPSTPFISGPPGTKPEDHPDYERCMREMYGQ